jgi:hypothetical protein
MDEKWIKTQQNFCLSCLGLLRQTYRDWVAMKRDIYFSQFWRQEVHEQGVARFWWGLSSGFADCCFLVSSHSGEKERGPPLSCVLIGH